MPRLACAPQRQPPFKQLIEEPGERRANTMQKKPQKPQKPRLIHVRDCRGDELVLPRIAQELIDGDRAALRATTVREDLQATRRRPLDAPMASWSDDVDVREREAWADKTNYALDDVVPPLGIGRLVLTLLLMASSFIAGVAVGRW